MSIMQTLFGSFGGGSNNTPAAQQPQQPPGATPPGNMPATAGATDQNNPTVPAGTQSTEQNNPQTESPLAAFADLWQPNDTKGEPQDTSFLGAVDPAKVMAAAKNTDFTKIITKDQLAKINAGGPEAMQTMMEAMNSVSQAAFAQSAMASAKMVEAALSKAQTRFASELPAMMKKQMVSENLRGENPIFSNPAVAPIISALEHQLTQKFPTASSAEITQMAKSYISDFGNAVVPKQESTAQTAQNQEYDWSKFLN